MRTQFLLIATLIVIVANWPGKTCLAQDPQPANPRAGELQAQEAAAPQILPAIPALPAIRLVPAMPQAAGLAGNAGAARATRAATGLPFDLSNLVLAKFDESPKGPQLVALVEQTRMEQRTVAITRVRQEVQTRKVKTVGADGKETEVEQNYTVSIPFTENIERAVPVPAGKKPTAFPLDELRIHRLDGSRVAEADARVLLEKMGPIFLLRGFTGDIKAVEGVYLQALNPNCLIVVTEKIE